MLFVYRFLRAPFSPAVPAKVPKATSRSKVRVNGRSSSPTNDRRLSAKRTNQTTLVKIETMKKQSIIVPFCAVAALLSSSCSQEVEQPTNGDVAKTYVATVENSTNVTRSYNAGSGSFVWSAGDDISVYTANGFQTMKFKSGAHTGIATYEDVTFIPQDIAVFPTTAVKSYTSGALSVTYPSEIKHSSNANDPLVAQFNKGQTAFNFKHVGGVLAFEINMPAGVDAFVVTADKPICGDFAVDMTGDAPTVKTTADGTDGKSVTFTFDKTTASGIMNFYLPVPTGTYSSLTLEAKNGNDVVKELTNSSSNTIDRCDWTVFSVNMCSCTATIEQVVTGVTAFNKLLNETSAAELAKKDITLDLNGETFANTNTAQKCITTLSVNSLTLKDGTVDASGLNIKAAGSVTLKDIKLTGAFPKTNSNSRVTLNTSGKIVIDGLDFTETTNGYNGIEINLSANPVSSDIEIKNCKFGPVPTNNCISIFGIAEDGKATVENCDFDLNANSDAVRISNKFNANHFTVNFKNCSYKYNGTTKESFLLFQDYTNGAEAATKKQFSGLTINCENVTKNGTKVTELGTLSGTDMSNQFAYVYYNNGGVQTDNSHYPTFTFK